MPVLGPAEPTPRKYIKERAKRLNPTVEWSYGTPPLSDLQHLFTETVVTVTAGGVFSNVG